MRTESRLSPAWRLGAALALLIALAPAAQAANAPDGDRDPPSRAARVVSVVGDAWLFDHDTREWTRLSRNQTVGEGDRVRTDDRARVSLRVGSTSLWVDERSDLELTQLDDRQTLLQLDRGDVALRLRSAEIAAGTQLRTREGTASPEREGLYRVEQLDRGSKVYAWQGRLRFDWARPEGAPLWLGDGEQVEFWWPGSPRAERSRLYTDGFGEWVLAESRSEGDRTVARYVSPEMTGAEDLDRHGRWESSPDYGNVWIPTVVVAGWAPYRHGNWAWSRQWGWTWVDDAPWGFAPFHYGRWVSWGGRWCWAPGGYVARPVYAPALVGWVGGGPVSVSVGIGGRRPPPPRHGWYPLAPREVFVPGYRHSPGYVQRVNDPRDLRDPVTVQRPHRYRDEPKAVSTLPLVDGGMQPQPQRGGGDRAGFAGRAEATGPLPLRPVQAEPARLAVRVPEPGMAWRSEGQLPVRRDRAPEPAVMPAPPAVIAAPQMPVEPPRGRDAEMPWRGQREDRREDRRPSVAQPQPQAEVPQPQPTMRHTMPMPMQVPMPERPVERQPEPQRPQQRGFDGPPVRQMQPQPQPQMQMPPPQVQQPQRAEERSPQRNREDGVPRRNGRGERENER